MKEKDQNVQNIESRYKPIEVLARLQSLQHAQRINGVGFDVFDTLLKSLYTDTQMVEILSVIISDYLMERGASVPRDVIFNEYLELRKKLRNDSSKLRSDIPIKEQETLERVVVESFGLNYNVGNNKRFFDFVQERWMDYDLHNITPVPGMTRVVSESIKLFGRKHVGIYTNHSYDRAHVLSILSSSGIVGPQMIDPKNVFSSINSGLVEYSVCLRKPNPLAFTLLSNKLDVLPNELAFVGDGKNDYLFAERSAGVGIRFGMA